MPVPADWQNPISAAPGTLQADVDPAQLLPSRADLDYTRVEAQRRLLLSRTNRFTPVLVTPGGVIIDGHHMVRAAAEEGKLIEVRVVGMAQPPAGELILNLPLR